MTHLYTELQRLYGHPGQLWRSRRTGAGGTAPLGGELKEELLGRALREELAVMLDLWAADGRVRAMVISVLDSHAWDQVAALCQGVVTVLALPTPAISVSPDEGYQIWFSLAEAVPRDQAVRFLAALGRRYLADLPAARLRRRPAADEASRFLPLVPACHAQSEAGGQCQCKWSAFIDPGMGEMFAGEPGLELAPAMDRQAERLAAHASISASDFQRALAMLEAADAEPSSMSAAEPAGSVAPSSAPSLALNYPDPQSFLLAVMNSSAVSLSERIEAARALLPYFVSERQ